MSFYFRVTTPAEPPRFDDVIAAAGFPWPVQLADADAATPWPAGRLPKVTDASSVPETEAQRQTLLAMLRQHGSDGAFLLYAPARSTRGVEVTRTRWDGAHVVQARVCAAASVEDYEIAARFTAALAASAGAGVQAEHGPDGAAIGVLAPDEILRRFDAAFARRNALEMARGLASFGGYVYGPRGWLALPPLTGDIEAWLGEVQEKLRAGASSGSSVPAASREDALLLLGAMARAAAADGQVTSRELQTMSTICTNVPQLARFSDRELEAMLADAGVWIQQPTGVLVSRHSRRMREKAVILGVEVVTRGVEATFGADDANVRGLVALCAHLGVPESVGAAALQAMRAKYVPGEIDDEMAITIVEAMLFVAAADGRVSTGELRAIAAVLGTVPQFEGRDLPALIEAARESQRARRGTLGPRLSAFPRFRDKTFALVCEVAQAGGAELASAMVLATIEQTLRPPTATLPAAARAVFAAKYAAA